MAGRMLWHYTSLDALYHILKERQLYASNLRYMNDVSEFRFTSELLVSLVENPTINRLTQPGVIRPRPGAEQEIWELVGDWARIKHPPAIYVVCLSAAEDLLSQWVSYRQQGPGVAIGFDMDAFEPLAVGQGFRVVECHYDASPTVTIEALRGVLEGVVDRRPAELASADLLSKAARKGFVLSVARQAWDEVCKQAVRVKHEGFREEKEFRLVTEDGMTSPRVRVRSSGGKLLPYIPIELPKGKRLSAEFPIRQLCLGPVGSTVVRDLHMFALNRLVVAEQLEITDIRASDTPLGA